MAEVNAKPAPGMMESVKMFFGRYADFKGRSRRAEYWMVTLFNMVLAAVLLGLFSVMDLYSIGAGLWGLYIVASLVPSLALTVRRLHDVGRSGWFFLLMFIPVINLWPAILVMFIDSKVEANQWGESPKYGA